jgi:osmoprotectant transport system permease protein
MISQGDVDWLLTHLDDIAYRTFQHLYLTTIAVAVGFVISFGLAIVAVRRRNSAPIIQGASDLLYTIPSLALFGTLITITGISLLTVQIPLVLYTLTILVRNIVTGLRDVPPDALDAANGLGFTGRQRLWRVEVPLAVPLIVAGVRLAAVSTIGLVTVTAIMGDSYGGLGFFILEGYRRSFPLELYVGAIPSILLAFVVDAALVRAQRRVTPWSQELDAERVTQAPAQRLGSA